MIKEFDCENNPIATIDFYFCVLTDQIGLDELKSHLKVCDYIGETVYNKLITLYDYKVYR